jgi:hypothetical protein
MTPYSFVRRGAAALRHFRTRRAWSRTGAGRAEARHSALIDRYPVEVWYLGGPAAPGPAISPNPENHTTTPN